MVQTLGAEPPPDAARRAEAARAAESAVLARAEEETRRAEAVAEGIVHREVGQLRSHGFVRPSTVLQKLFSMPVCSDAMNLRILSAKFTSLVVRIAVRINY